MNLPEGFPNEQNKIAFEWNDRSRIDRINELLRAKTKMTLADSMAIQTDAVSTQSRRAVALLAALSSPDAEIARALALLQAWDHDESTGSAAAAIYEVWATKHLCKAAIARATPEAAHKRIDNPQLQSIIEFLEHPDGALGEGPAAARDAILVESLKGALTEIGQRPGPAMNTSAR